MKRTFQVALFGASDAANRKLLASLRRERGGELVAVPDGSLGSIAHWFDYDIDTDRGLRARFRVRTVSARFRIQTVNSRALDARAGLALFQADAVVFVPSGKRDRAFRRAAEEYFAAYGGATAISGPARADDIERVVVEGFRAGRIKGRATTSPTKAYLSRANAMSVAAQIAVDVGPRSMRRFHQSMRARALHPELGFATLSSLSSLETAFFTYWNEAPARDTATFWREVARRRLPFQRRDVVAEALARGRITNRGDYETITDLLSDPGLRPAQRKRLDAMLGAHELARTRR